MYRLSNSFPYLLARVGIRIGGLFEEVVAKEGLTLQGYRVLAALSEAARPLKLVELSALTSADISTLSRLVSQMYRKGILLRERPEHDQRSLQVTLTKKGEALVARFIPVAVHYEELATRTLSVEESRALKATLRQLFANLDLIKTQLADGTIASIVENAASQTARREKKLKQA